MNDEKPGEATSFNNAEDVAARSPRGNNRRTGPNVKGPVERRGPQGERLRIFADGTVYEISLKGTLRRRHDLRANITKRED